MSPRRYSNRPGSFGSRRLGVPDSSMRLGLDRVDKVVAELRDRGLELVSDAEIFFTCV